MPMPEFIPTPEQRFTVQRAIAFGLNNQQIAALIRNPRTGESISEMLVPRVFADEVAAGSGPLVYEVANRLLSLALRAENEEVSRKACEVLLTRRGGTPWQENIRSEVEARFIVPGAQDILMSKIANCLRNSPQAPQVQPMRHLQLVDPDNQ